MIIDYRLYSEKLEYFYFKMIEQKNIDYLKENGVGPYEFQGRFKDRVTPWLDAGYWQEYNKWLESEYCAVRNGNNIAFASKNDAILFMLRWS